MAELRILGIDPGLTGALALLSRSSHETALDVWDMPEVHKTVDAAATGARCAAPTPR